MAEQGEKLEETAPDGAGLTADDCCACHGRNLLYSNRTVALYGEAFPTNTLLGNFNGPVEYMTYCNPLCYGTTTDGMCCGPTYPTGCVGSSPSSSNNGDNDKNNSNTNNDSKQQLLQVIVDDGIVYDEPQNHDQQQEQNLSPRSLMATIDESHNLKINPYHVLQIRRDATDSEIGLSYRRLALWHHPGRRSSCDTKEERRQRLQVFEVLAACYETLISKESRRRFDTQYKFMEKRIKSSMQQLTTTTATRSGSGKLPEMPGGMFMGGKPLFFGSLPYALKSWDYGSGGGASTSQATTVSKSLVDRLKDANDKNDDGDGSVPALYRSASSVHSSSSDEDNENYFDPQQSQSHMNHNHDQNDTERLMILSFSSPTSQKTVFSSDTPPSLFDSLVPNGSTSGSGSSSDDAVAEKHFTQVETERLFGGPLSDLYRARNFRPFTDSFQVFEDVFGSKMFHTSVEEIGGRLRKWSPTILQSKVVHSKNTTSGLVTSQEVLPDDKNTCVIRTSRQVQNRKLTRTETVTIDPKTRQRYSVVTVTTEQIPALKQKDDIRGGFGRRGWGQNNYHDDGITAGAAENSSYAFFFQIMKCTTPGCGDDTFWHSMIGSNNKEGGDNSNNNEEPWCDIFALCHQLSDEVYGLQQPPYNYGWINWTNALECNSFWFPADATATR